MGDSLESIYAEVPAVHCKGLCQASCGPIVCSSAEAHRIQGNGSSLPRVIDTKAHGPLTCDKLTTNGRCSIYQDRPLICRLFGAVKLMACPHGCMPDRWLSDADSRALLKRTQRVPPVGSDHVSL